MATRTANVPRLLPGLRALPARRSRPQIGVRQIAWLLLAVLMFFTLIYSRVFLDGAAFEIATLERAVEMQEARFDELRLEVAQLESPQRIFQEAQGMGMELPDEARTVYAPLPHVAEGIDEIEAGGSALLLATLGAE